MQNYLDKLVLINNNLYLNILAKENLKICNSNYKIFYIINNILGLNDLDLELMIISLPNISRITFLKIF